MYSDVLNQFFPVLYKMDDIIIYNREFFRPIVIKFLFIIYNNTKYDIDKAAPKYGFL